MTETETRPAEVRTGGTAARAVLWLIALWIAAGAYFKLFHGSPGDLPPAVRDVPLPLGVTYSLAIAIELTCAALAFLKPRWAWPLLLVTLLVFDLVLSTQIAAGAESCGCFGSSVPITPEIMLAIDTTMLVALLATRPWSRLGKDPVAAPAAVAVCAVLFAAPWFLSREADDGPSLGPIVADGEPPQDARESGETGGGSRRWAQLELGAWAGKDLGETPLANWLDVYAMPPDALWVFWRATCEHCAEHLAHLADSEFGERFLVLLQLEEPHDSDLNRVVHKLPQGDFVTRATLPSTVDWVITTPGELEVEAFVVVSGEEGVGPDDGAH